jgi:hypothetical protein
MPSLPFSMTITKLPDKHIPYDVATGEFPLATVTMDGEFWAILAGGYTWTALVLRSINR